MNRYIKIKQLRKKLDSLNERRDQNLDKQNQQYDNSVNHFGVCGLRDFTSSIYTAFETIEDYYRLINTEIYYIEKQLKRYELFIKKMEERKEKGEKRVINATDIYNELKAYEF